MYFSSTDKTAWLVIVQIKDITGYHITFTDQRHRMEEIALITGGSEGVGAGIATVLAKQVRLVICFAQFQAVCRE